MKNLKINQFESVTNLTKKEMTQIKGGDDSTVLLEISTGKYTISCDQNGNLAIKPYGTVQPHPSY